MAKRMQIAFVVVWMMLVGSVSHGAGSALPIAHQETDGFAPPESAPTETSVNVPKLIVERAHVDLGVVHPV